MNNLYDIDPDAASRRRHPTVSDVDLDQESEDDGFADLDATFDQLSEVTAQLHDMIAEHLTRTPRTNHLLLTAAVSTGFAIASLFWLLILVATTTGARP